MNSALETDKLKKFGDVTMTGVNLFGLAIVGLMGGVIVGWLSVGLDIAIFIFLTFFYNVCFD